MKITRSTINILNFKFSIGDRTNKGTIETRYYQEWKNRHGADQCGYFYVMEDGKSFNEDLIELIQ